MELPFLDIRGTCHPNAGVQRYVATPECFSTLSPGTAKQYLPAAGAGLSRRRNLDVLGNQPEEGSDGL